MKRMILVALFSLVCTAWAVEQKDAPSSYRLPLLQAAKRSSRSATSTRVGKEYRVAIGSG